MFRMTGQWGNGLGVGATPDKVSRCRHDRFPPPGSLPGEGVAKAPPWACATPGRKLRFPAPYVFNGLQPPKTAVRPCTTEAVTFCDSLRGRGGIRSALREFR